MSSARSAPALGGKVAIVTGGGSGLGAAIAARLAADGARVLIADLKGAEAIAAGLVEAGHHAIATVTDVADWDAVERMAATARDAFGSIDILVNNAAISSGMALTPFEKIETAAFARMLGVNTIGTFHGCKAVAPTMRAQRSGRIINLASGTAFRGSPFILPYVASKGAVMTMTRALAHELGGDGITVNAVSPGYTLTQSNLDNAEYMDAVRPGVLALRALKRDAWPEDIVGAVAFLAGDDARFITGQILAVDGGAVYH